MFEAVATHQQLPNDDRCNEANVRNLSMCKNTVQQTLYKEIVLGLKGLTIYDFVLRATMMGYLSTDGRVNNLTREEKWLFAAYRNKPLNVEGSRNNNLYRVLYGFGMDFGLERLEKRYPEILARSTLSPKEKHLLYVKASSNVEYRQRIT